MPILNFDKDFPNLPDLDKVQKCDECGDEFVGKFGFYAYPPEGVSVICLSCFGEYDTEVVAR